MMRALSVKLLVAVLALALGGCAGFTTRVDFDPAANLKTLNTYAWVPHDGAYQTLDQTRIRRAVDAGLVSRGMTQVAEAEAGVWVDVDYALARRYEARSNFYGFYGWHPYWWAVEPDVRLEERDESTLTILLIDPASKAVVWTGQTVVRYYAAQPPAEREASLQAQVDAILQRFPRP